MEIDSNFLRCNSVMNSFYLKHLAMCVHVHKRQTNLLSKNPSIALTFHPEWITGVALQVWKVSPKLSSLSIGILKERQGEGLTFLRHSTQGRRERAGGKIEHATHCQWIADFKSRSLVPQSQSGHAGTKLLTSTATTTLLPDCIVNLTVNNIAFFHCQKNPGVI